MRKIRRATKGKINKLIDDSIHPYFKQYPILTVVDGLLHAMVEQNPDTSLKKFVKYNLPKLLENASPCKKAKKAKEKYA